MVPQNPEQPLTPSELATPQSDTQNVLQGRKDCTEFISGLLLTAATNTQRALYSTEFIADPMKIFDAVASSKNGGFFLAPDQGGAGRAWGGLSRGNAKITLYSIFRQGLTNLHEMAHEASGVGIDKYLDRELAFAAYQTAWAQGYKNLPRPPRSDNVARNSQYWDELLFKACSPNQQRND